MPTWTAFQKFVVSRYLTVDLRTLALFRVFFGLVLLVDILRRLPFATEFYSNEGVLPNHFALFAPMSDPAFSLFFAVSTPDEARVALVVGALLAVAYIVGYRTRVMQVSLFVFMTSLNVRNLFVENGGVVVVGVVAAWSMFLPLGERHSVDAWLRSRREPAVVTARAPAFVSLAMLAITLQLCVIYFLNMAQKFDPTWTTGEAVHWVLWQDRIATPFTAWLRLHEPSWFSYVSTRGTLVVEGSMPLLLLSPFFQKWLRPLHVLLAIGLHGGIALMMNIGPFSYGMIALNLLMIPGSTFDALERVRARIRSRRSVGPSSAVEPSPLVSGDAVEPERNAERTPARFDLHAVRVVSRELAVMLLLVAVGQQVTRDNGYFRSLPPRFRQGPAGVLKAVIQYPRLLQGWSMFASIPKGDGTLVVDAVTPSGEHVDPLTGSAPDFDVLLHGPTGMSQLECDYYLRIANEGARGYRDALLRFLRTKTLVNGHYVPANFTKVEVFWVTTATPPPGSVTPTRLDRTRIAEWHEGASTGGS